MVYQSNKDPARYQPTGRNTFGNSGAPIVPSDTVDLAVYAKSIVVTTAGNLAIIPTGNADAVSIAFVNLPVGYVVPYTIRRVLSTGTTAAVASIMD